MRVVPGKTRQGTNRGLIGFAKHEEFAFGKVQTDTPTVRWYKGRLESTAEVLRCSHAPDNGI